MEFKCFTVGESEGEMVEYGNYHPTKPPETSYMLNDVNFKNAVENKDPLVLEYIRFLALCHDVKIDHETESYNASSPDELAFVEFTENVGMKFAGKPKKKKGDEGDLGDENIQI